MHFSLRGSPCQAGACLAERHLYLHSAMTFFEIFDLTSWFVTWGQKEGGISFGPWNHDRWQQRTHKFEYVFCCWLTNQELMQQTVKIELLKPTTANNWTFMPFLDTNSHLSTKPYNFDIKFQSNSESYDRHGFSGTKFRRGQNFVLTVWGFFNEREYSAADWLVPLICNGLSYLEQHSCPAGL